MHRDQYDDLFAILGEGVSRLRLGSVLTPSQEGYVHPIDCGAMIDGERFQSLERLVREAADEGAEVLGGGQRWSHICHGHGTYFSATVVGPVNSEMEIAQTERR